MIFIDRELCINCGRCAAACPMGIFSRDEGGTVRVGAEKRCIRCMHCSAACPRQAVRREGVGTEALYPAQGEDEVLRLVQRRRSVRHFRPEAPRREVLQKALEGAAYAPSAKNLRPCRWTVLYGKERADEAAALALRWGVETRADPALVAMARSGKNLITCGAPCVFLCHAPRAAGAATDGAIAAATLELLLCRAGLGTCWAGYLTRIAEHAPALRDFLGISEEDEVLCALMAGWPEGEDFPNLPYRPAGEIRWLEAP